MSHAQTNDSEHSDADKPKADQAPREVSDQSQAASSKPAKEENAPTTSDDALTADETLPDLDEGPRPGPVDEIQEALFEAAQKGAATEVDMGELPAPMPDLDEAPHSGQVGEIQEIASDETLKRGSTEIEMDELPTPLTDLDEGPRPSPVDEVQEAIFKAAQAGRPTEVEFDQLPGPGLPTKPQKVIKFKQKSPAESESELETKPIQPKVPPEPEAEAVRLPDFPPPAPIPTSADFWLLLALFVSFRGLTLFLLRPGGFIRDWSDFDTYFGIASLADYSLFPFFDFWLEWPPLVPWLAVGVYKVSLLLPPWPDDPRLWFILILGGLFFLFEIGNFLLIYRLARRLFESSTGINRVLWFYAGLFPPVYAMLGFFDGMALFFILLALDFLLDDRRFRSAAAVGVGFMVKIIPIIFLPIALRRLWHQYRANRQDAGIELGLYAVVAGLTMLVLLAPFLIGGPQWVLASGRSMMGRSSWETVWAVAEGYHGFGIVEGDRLNPAETDFAVHDSSLPWWLISLAFTGIYAFVFTRSADYSRPRQLIAFSGLTVSIFMLYNKGYSPQFLVYLLPFIVLLFPNLRGLTYALIFTGLNILEQPIYFVLLPNSTWLLTLVVITRFLLIIIVALEFALVLWPLAERRPWLTEFHRRVPSIVGIAAATILLILIPVLFRAYTANRLHDSPVAVFASFMQTQAQTVQPDSGKPRLLMSDQATYQQVYPHLNRNFDLQLTDGAAKNLPGAPQATDFLPDLDTIWILPTGPQQQALRDAVERRGEPIATFGFTGLGTASLYSFEDNPRPFIAPARFVGGIELLMHQVKKEPGAVNVTLYWRAVDPQSQSYTVFTQLLDAEDQLVASHDSPPANDTAPTDTWPVNAVQVDPHRIELPPDLPRGEYTLITGMYNRFNERLRSIDPEGFGFPNRAVPLATIQLP